MASFNPFDPTAAFLMGAGSGLLRAGGWSPMPVSLGQAMGAGLQGGRQSYMDAVRMAQLQRQQQIEEGIQKAKMARMAAQQQAQEAYLASLTPEQQTLARAQGVPEYIEAQAAGGWLEGTGTTQQMFNTYENVLNKLQTGEEVSPREYQRALIAQRQLTQPQTRFDPNTQEIVTTQANYPPLPPMPGTAPLTPVETEQMQEATVTGDTTVSQTPGGTVTRTKVGTKKFPEGQSKAAGFAYRMRNTADIITDFAGRGVEFPVWTEALKEIGVPGTRFFQSPEEQQMVTAAMEFARAVNRKESGAQISETEVRDAMNTYFPQPGDSQSTIEFKETLREDLIESVKRESQGAYEALFENAPATQAPEARGPGAARIEAGQRRRRLRYNPQTGRLE